MQNINLITAANNATSYQLAWQFKHEIVHFCDNVAHKNIIPPPTDNSFSHQFLKYCLTHNITRVFPLRMLEIQALSESEILFEEFGIELMLTQPAILEDINSKFNTNFIEVNNFTEFSAAVLKAGYPSKNVWFGKADFSGKLYQINDTQKKLQTLWKQESEISFLQASKFLQLQPFIPIYVYESKPLVLNVLFINDTIYYDTIVNENQKLVLKKLHVEHNLKGYFELFMLDEELLHLKMFTV